MMSFFEKSEWLDYYITKPLSHIRRNWELTWDDENNCYAPEDDSYAEELNKLIEEIGKTTIPESYHNNEDFLAEHVKSHLGWNIDKNNGRWENADYTSILEQGSFSLNGVDNLLQAIAGRIETARQYEQLHFDEMEEGHMRILALAMSVILYQRS